MKKHLRDHVTELKSKLTPQEMSLVQDILSEQDAEWQKKLLRIPLLAPLLGGFGLVTTFYGFEKILDQTTLVDHPVLMLSLGVAVLLLTGFFYRKL